MLLFLVKVIFSSLFFHSGSVPAIPLPFPDIAMAESKGKAQPEKTAPDAQGEMNPDALKQRAKNLRARELELKKREEELLPLKKEIEEKLAELNELQNRLTGYAKTLADREEALKEGKVGHLVELYSAMEPAKAAAIMDKLKMETVVGILRRMKGKAAGQILAMMKPETGAAISEKLSTMD